MRLLLFALLLLPFFAAAQTINPALVRSYWPARWIAHPTTPGKQYGVFHFRKTVELEQKPGTYVIQFRPTTAIAFMSMARWCVRDPRAAIPNTVLGQNTWFTRRHSR